MSNLVIFTGYLLTLDGIAGLNGCAYRKGSVGAVAALALLWLIAGWEWQDAMWNYGTALFIAGASGLASWEMFRSHRYRASRSRYLIIAATGCHALLYAARGLILPSLALVYGDAALKVASGITMYEGVLYAMALSMGLLALIREEAQGQLERLALTDHLTGVGNRRWFFERGAALCSAPVGPVSLLAFDMDHFKQINDRYGHQIGDEVLKAFARITVEVIGADAVFARMGGEEFAAILPGRDLHATSKLGRAVVHRFAAEAASRVNGLALHATVSVGAAELQPHKDLNALLSAADRALYCAKALGRNRIEMAETPPLRAIA